MRINKFSSCFSHSPSNPSNASDLRIFAALIGGLTFFLMLGLLQLNSTSAQDNQPKITIDNATFGEGRSLINCKDKIQAIVSNSELEIDVTNEGLGLPNQAGPARRDLKIVYSIDGKQRYVIFNVGQKLKLYQAILDHSNNGLENIAIENSVFGEGKNRVNCTFQVRERFANKDLVTTISKEGLGLANVPDAPRNHIEIGYTYDLKAGMISFKAGSKVNLYQAILEKIRAENKTAPATISPSTNAPVTPPDAKAMVVDSKVDENAIPIEGMTRFAWGGAGRYLAVQTSKDDGVSIFDLTTRKVVAKADIRVNDLICASLTKLFSLSLATGTVRRWDLLTGKLELEKRIQLQAAPSSFVTGCSGSGPLGIWVSDRIRLIDAETLALLPEGDDALTIVGGNDGMVNVSADGKTFCGWLQRAHGRVLVVQYDAGKQKTVDKMFSGRWLSPSADGALLVSETEIFDMNSDLTRSSSSLGQFLLPTSSPIFKTKVTDIERKQSRLTFLAGNSERPIPGELIVPFLADGHNETELQVNILPEQNLVIAIPESNDRIVIHQFDFTGAIADDEILVASTPPTKATAKEDFKYQLNCWSKTPVKYQVAKGPPGLKIDDSGLVSWTPDQASGGSTAEIQISISNESGGKTNHDFELSVAAAPFVLKRKTLPLAEPGGWVMTPDGITLIVAVPEEGRLIYYDTIKEVEEKRVDLDFKPMALALQGKTLFASSKGSAIVHALELETGKAKKEFDLRSDAIANLACHPSRGMVYASTENFDVYLLDPTKGTSLKTNARGYYLACDPKNGEFLYTGLQPRDRDEIIFRTVETDNPDEANTVRIIFDDWGRRAMLFKYKITVKKLTLVSSQNNAAVNGRWMHLTPDGSKIMMVGGGGWRPQGDGVGGGYITALFNTANLQSRVGELPSHLNVVFHPVLDLGVINDYGNELLPFRKKALVMESPIPIDKTGEQERRPSILAFGAQGTKIIVWNGTDFSKKRGLQFIQLSLTPEQEAETKKAFEKQASEANR